MKKKINLFLATCLLLYSCLPMPAQTKSSTQSPIPPPASQTHKSPLAFGLEDGTPIKLRLNRTMSSADAKTGETVDFEVLEDIKIGEILVIPRGGIAWATVTEAQPKRRMGRGGKLNINIDSVRLVNGEKAALRAVKETSGGGHTGAMTGAIVATSIVFFPAAPFFLFMKGKDITIPKGTEVTAYVNGDTSLDPKRFAPSGQEKGATVSSPSEPGTGQAPSSSDTEFSSINIKSSPDGADIAIDGKFSGSTPSTLRLKSGEHKISIKKTGYGLWERTITTNPGGNITVDVALERIP
jgi:hypothetical protein